MTDPDPAAVKRERAIKIGASILLALPAFYVTVRLLLDGRTQPQYWTQLEMAVWAVSFGTSLLVGWRANYETMFGDQSIYVEEPEVNDDWE